MSVKGVYSRSYGCHSLGLFNICFDLAPYITSYLSCLHSDVGNGTFGTPTKLEPLDSPRQKKDVIDNRKKQCGLCAENLIKFNRTIKYAE